VVAGLIVVAGVLFFFRGPLEVRILANRLASPDPMVRADARTRLLAIGRPAIDGVYARLVASEVEDEVTNVIAAAVVTSGSVVVDVLARDPSFPEEALGVAPVGTPTCPTAQTLGRTRGPRELQVRALRKKGDAVPELRVHVALEGPRDQELLAVVRSALGGGK
jgi:hypothetical protein